MASVRECLEHGTNLFRVGIAQGGPGGAGMIFSALFGGSKSSPEGIYPRHNGLLTGVSLENRSKFCTTYHSCGHTVSRQATITHFRPPTAFITDTVGHTPMLNDVSPKNSGCSK